MCVKDEHQSSMLTLPLQLLIPTGRKSALFLTTLEKKSPEEDSDCFGLDHILISEPITWTGCSGQDWVMLPTSVVRECGLINQTIWRRSPQKGSMTIKKWERKPCLTTNKQTNKICSYQVLARGHSAQTHSHLSWLQIPFTPTLEKKGRNRRSNYLRREDWC